MGFFENVDTPNVKISLQEKKDLRIEKKKAGHPRKPNMEKVHIKLSSLLHHKLKSYAKTRGVNKSALISEALMGWMKTNPIED